jgi:hypothetical protein
MKPSPWILALVIVLSPLIVPFLLVFFVVFILTSICLHVLIWTCWCTRGRDILFVYSDSPVWHDYIEQHLLPPIRQRAIVNWSQRKRWGFSLARAAFRHFGGRREFNPLAVVFRPFWRTRKFRFWQPFREWKHGSPASSSRWSKTSSHSSTSPMTPRPNHAMERTATVQIF